MMKEPERLRKPQIKEEFQALSRKGGGKEKGTSRKNPSSSSMLKESEDRTGTASEEVPLRAKEGRKQQKVKNRRSGVYKVRNGGRIL